jgi:hypothetical protein
VAYLQAYRTEEAVELEMRALRQALEREMPGCEVELLKIEPSFEEPVTGEFYWLAPHARQAAETRRDTASRFLPESSLFSGLWVACFLTFWLDRSKGPLSRSLCPTRWSWRSPPGSE